MMQVLPHTPAEGGSGRDRERQLVLEVLRKDRKATAEFVACCADWLYPFVSRHLAPRTEMVEDLMQEILLSAWQSLPNFRGDAGLRAWILGIAGHKVEDYYRKRIREAESQGDEATAESGVTPRLDEQLDKAAERARIQQALGLLPEGYALALIWRYREEKSVREIAELTGKTEKAVERLLARARESFRRRWNDGQP